MEHSMWLHPAPMEMIRSGRKTIELRLYDEKRRGISAGDTICFRSREDPQDTLRVQVEDIYIFSSFAELYRELPLLQCGYTAENAASASPDDMTEYYSKEEQARFGVVGIRIKLL